MGFKQQVTTLSLSALWMFFGLAIQSAQGAAPQYDESNMNRCAVLNAPWDRFFRSAPHILLVSKLPDELESILEESQERIKHVLDQNAKPHERSEYAELKERLMELRSKVPSKNAQPPVHDNGRPYAYQGMDCRKAREHLYYSKFSILENKAGECSPDFIRSVENLVRNINLDDIGQRYEALVRLMNTWRRRSEQYSEEGTSGDIRNANEMYLLALEKYSEALLDLKERVSRTEAKLAAAASKTANALSEWNTFQSTQLSELEAHIRQNSARITAHDNIFRLPRRFKGHILYACQIGAHTLYFELDDERQPQHPFVLVDLS